MTHHPHPQDATAFAAACSSAFHLQQDGGPSQRPRPRGPPASPQLAFASVHHHTSTKKHSWDPTAAAYYASSPTPNAQMVDREHVHIQVNESQVTVAHRTEVRGRTLRPSQDAERIRRTVHFKNIPKHLTPVEMRQIFDLGGYVLRVRVAKFDSVDNYLFAFVEYASVPMAIAALQAVNHMPQVEGYRLCASPAKKAIHGGSDLDACEALPMCSFGLSQDRDERTYIVNEARRPSARAATAAPAESQVAKPHEDDPVVAGTMQTVTLNPELRVVCDEYVAEPTTAAFDRLINALSKREAQLDGSCSVALLPALVERHHVALVHMAALLHHAHGTSFTDADKAYSALQSAAALDRYPSTRVPANAAILGQLAQHHVAAGLLFEGCANHQNDPVVSAMPLKCYSYANVICTLLFGANSVGAQETARICSLAMRNIRKYAQSRVRSELMPGVTSVCGTILQGNVSFSFW